MPHALATIGAGDDSGKGGLAMELPLGPIAPVPSNRRPDSAGPDDDARYTDAPLPHCAAPDENRQREEQSAEAALALDGRRNAGLRVLGVYALRIAGAGLAFILQIVLARWLSAYQYGIYATIFVCLMLLGGWMSGGLAPAMIRFIPEYRARHQDDLLRGLRRTSFIVAGIVSVIGVTVGLTLSLSSGGPLPAPYHEAVVFAALMLPFLALIEINDGYCRGQGMPISAMGPALIVRPLVTLSGIGIAVFALGLPGNAGTAMSLALAAAAVTAVVQLVLATRSTEGRRHTAARRSDAGVAARYDLRAWISVAFPIVFIEGLLQLMGAADILLIGALMSPDNVGHYYAASRILVLVGFVPVAVVAVMAPGFAYSAARGDADGLARSVNQAIGLSFWPALMLALGLVVVGPWLLMAFGASFSDAYPALLILAVAAIVRAFIAPAQTMLVITGHQGTAMMILGGAVVGNVALNLLLIPVFGITGAATATTTAVVAEVVASAVIIRRLCGFQPMPAFSPRSVIERLRSRRTAGPETIVKDQEG